MCGRHTPATEPGRRSTRHQLQALHSTRMFGRGRGERCAPVTAVRLAGGALSPATSSLSLQLALSPARSLSCSLPVSYQRLMARPSDGAGHREWLAVRFTFAGPQPHGSAGVRQAASPSGTRTRRGAVLIRGGCMWQSADATFWLLMTSLSRWPSLGRMTGAPARTPGGAPPLRASRRRAADAHVHRARPAPARRRLRRGRDRRVQRLRVGVEA